MEAAVQRDPTNAARWYELGVKQQENEREQKAIQALRRAIELDPTHLASWLALAISHTNEGNRSAAYNSIREWLERNERYSAAVAQFRALNPEPAEARPSEKLTNMMQCLMSIVRENAGRDIDADIQIALAVLLNTNEVRSPCFLCLSDGRGFMYGSTDRRFAITGLCQGSRLFHDSACCAPGCTCSTAITATLRFAGGHPGIY